MFSALFLACLTFVNGSPASVSMDMLTKATDVSWLSYNFKTVLTWGPKPVNYTYTVEFSRVGRNRQRNPHCIRMTETECDLTNELKGDLKGVYFAEVLSEPSHGRTTDHEEFPFTRSNTFCPYNDTLIGRPKFKLMVNENKKIMLLIQDPVTALIKDGKPQNIRDIFKKNLKYKVAYNKAGSTGKKTQIVDENKFEFSKLDEDQSYCFSVAAYIPSRKGSKRVGEWSLPKCSQGQKTLFEEYGLAVIGGAAFVILLMVIALIVLIVLWCKRVRRQSTTKETIVV